MQKSFYVLKELIQTKVKIHFITFGPIVRNYNDFKCSCMAHIPLTKRIDINNKFQISYFENQQIGQKNKLFNH